MVMSLKVPLFFTTSKKSLRLIFGARRQFWLVNGHSCTANKASHSTDDSGWLLLDCCCPSEQVIASHRFSGPSQVRFSKNDDTKRHNSGQRRSLQQFDHDTSASLILYYVWPPVLTSKYYCDFLRASGFADSCRTVPVGYSIGTANCLSLLIKIISRVHKKTATIAKWWQS